jgi:hypothetical protein
VPFLKKQEAPTSLRSDEPVRVRGDDSLSSQGVNIGFIIAPQFNIIKTDASAQGVVRNVQHMVGSMIGQVTLQKMHFLIDRIHKAAFEGKQMKGSNATSFYRSSPFGHFIVNILCSQHRSDLLRKLLPLKTFHQILFTLIQYCGIFLLHSKRSSLRLVCFSRNLSNQY